MSAPICGAKARGSGRPCRLPAGWGTDHPGRGRCKLHGGASHGAPKGNKNALKTHEHEAIYVDTLTDDERALYVQVSTDALAQVEQELRLTEIRERRMLQRIAELQRESTYLADEITEEGDQVVGFGANTSVERLTRTTQRREASLAMIQRIEEALTRVQERKAKLIELAHKLRDGGQEDDGLKALAAAIAMSRRRMEEDGDAE